MVARGEVYRCSVCGNIVELLHAGRGELVCCGKPMDRVEVRREGKGGEKHLPVVTVRDGVVAIKVGLIEHPMEKSHLIEWVELVTDGVIVRRYLKPGEKPEVEFRVDVKHGRVRAYCSLHGLWETVF